MASLQPAPLTTAQPIEITGLSNTPASPNTGNLTDAAFLEMSPGEGAATGGLTSFAPSASGQTAVAPGMTHDF